MKLKCKKYNCLYMRSKEVYINDERVHANYILNLENVN
jgi:hypothetical protein